MTTRSRVNNVFTLALILYAISFFTVNWNEVSWVFNYKAVGGLVSDFFNPYPGIAQGQMDGYFTPNHSGSKKIVPNIKIGFTTKNNVLEIPAIGLTTNVVFSASSEKASLEKDLDSGVIYYPGSVYPGEVGQSVILGHSAPVGWPKIKHDWVFSNLEKLQPGDKIYLSITGRQYTYTVKSTAIIKPGADVPSSGSISENNVLTLVSCWPPGKDYQRIAVITELDNQ